MVAAALDCIKIIIIIQIIEWWSFVNCIEHLEIRELKVQDIKLRFKQCCENQKL